jgi:TonB family protein
VFPEAVRYDGFVSGYVLLAYSRTPDGEPHDILVLTSTHTRLTDAAVAAVREWRFQPTQDAAALAPRTVRLNFQAQGIVVLPFGKHMVQPLEPGLAGLAVGKSGEVPRLQDMPQAPRALNQPMPAYPAALAGTRMPGKAAVKFYVDEEGRVRLPQVTEATAPEFAEAALNAVSQWRYEPPRQGHRRLVVADNWQFRFGPEN